MRREGVHIVCSAAASQQQIDADLVRVVIHRAFDRREKAARRPR
jgi:hypothetical protein